MGSDSFKTASLQMDELLNRNGIESSSTIFEKVIPVRITKCGSEDRHMDLTIRFIMGVSKVHRTTKVLQVQITSECDPFFFYSLEVNEDDFQNLKVDQCILVDFATFPYKFIELLEQCIVSGCETPRFLTILNLRTGDSTLSIVETNQFKHLSHLSLCFRQGNDTTIKAYLAGRLTEFKTTNLDLHEKLRRTLVSLEKALHDVGNLGREVAECKEIQNRSINELKAEYALEIAHEKEKVMQGTAELREKLERERLDLENRFHQQADAQLERATELDKQVRTLLDAKYKLDSKVTELHIQFVAVEKDLDEKQQECERLRRENRSLDSEKHENTKQLNRQLIRLSALDQEVQDKNDLVANLTGQLDNQVSRRSALEGSWKEAQAAADCAEERANASATEISKCYQIIEKLQLELRSMRSKVKLKGQVTLQQDNLLQEKQHAVDKGLNEIHSLTHEVDHLKTDNESLKKKTDDLQGKLDEAQELVKSNQQLIQWLNQQLTEVQLGNLAPGGVSSRYLFRPTNSLAYSTNNNLVPKLTVDANGTGAFLSSISSIAENTSPTTFKTLNPSSHLFSAAHRGGPYISSVHMKTDAPCLNSGTTIAGSHSCCTVKAAAGGTVSSTGSGFSKVKYRPYHVSKVPSKSVNGVPGSSPHCSLGTDTSGSISWPDDASYWISKIGGASGVVLPRPQLSFAGFDISCGKSNGTSCKRATGELGCNQVQSSYPEIPSQCPQPQATSGSSDSPRPRSPAQISSPHVQSPQTQVSTVKIRAQHFLIIESIGLCLLNFEPENCNS